MNEQEFLELYNKEKNIYLSWGDYVKEYIIHTLKSEILDLKLDYFFKIPPSCRLKNDDSLLAKAFYRNKSYKDPYHDIQDKVGIRFVVLYLEDIQIIKKIIENCSFWNFSKDRDFIEEREKKPEMFGYESVHYIVQNKEEFNINNISIPQNTPCEIQIRTLLQHAYCEVSHSILYKNHVQNELKRLTSRSMALIESADYFFEEVKEMVSNTEMISSNLYKNLVDYYYSFAPKNDPEEKINNIIMDSLSELLYNDIFNDIKSLIEKENYLKNIIVNSTDLKLMYRQPTILLVYFLIFKKRRQLCDIWPLTDNDLIPLFNDCGVSFPE